MAVPGDHDVWWPDEQANYIRRRGERYPRGRRDPDPRSRTGAIRIVGYAPSAGFVVTVILDPMDGAGITAWKTSGADLRAYLEQKGADNDR